MSSAFIDLIAIPLPWRPQLQNRLWEAFWRQRDKNGGDRGRPRAASKRPDQNTLQPDFNLEVSQPGLNTLKLRTLRLAGITAANRVARQHRPTGPKSPFLFPPLPLH